MTFGIDLSRQSFEFMLFLVFVVLIGIHSMQGWTAIITKTTGESQTSTDDYRRVTNNYRRVPDESDTTTYESHRTFFWIHFYKTLFSERICLDEEMLLWKGGFYLKKENLGFDVY